MADAAGERDDGMTFWEHLAEMRRRLIVTALAMLAGVVAGWTFREPLFGLVTAPVREGLAAHGIYRLTAIETVEAIVVYLKVSVAAGILLCIPVGLHQLWGFVRPGLVGGEIRPMRRVAVLAFFMFLLGLLFCYRLVLPLVVHFLAAFTLASGGVDFQVTMQSAYSTALVFLVGFGIIFELPLVMVLLAATPLFDWRKYLKWLRYAIVLSFVVGAVLTPPDVVSQLLMAVPVSILYAVGIGLSFLMERRGAAERVSGTGFDWALAGLVVLLAGLVVLLLLPAPVPAAKYLPAGARAVVTASGPHAAGLSCGPATAGGEAALPPVVSVSCAEYGEGTLLVAQAEEGGDLSGLCRGPLAGSGEGSACAFDDGVLAAGLPMLVERFSQNRRERRVVSGLLGVESDATLVAFVSLDATPGRQRAWLRLERLPGDEVRFRLVAGFPDVGAAEDLARLMERDERPAQAARPAESREARLERAVEALCDAVELLSGEMGEAGREAGAVAGGVRALLAECGPPRPGRAGALLACGTVECALAVLDGLLPAPESVEVEGPVVTLAYRFSEVPGELMAVVRGLVR